MLRLLRNKNFALFFGGQITSLIGNNLFFIALFWFVLTETNSTRWLTYAGLCVELPGFLALFVGVWVDIWPKRRTMILSDVARFALSGGIFLVSVSNPRNVALILVLFLCLQIIGTVFEPASMAIVPELIRAESFPEASALLQSGASGAQLFGQVAGGVLIGFWGAPILFLANTLTFLVSFGSLSLVKVGKEQHITSEISFVKDFLAGFQQLRRSWFVFWITMISVLLNLSVAPMEVLFPVWIREELHMNATGLGILYGCLFGGMVIGGLSGGSLSKRLQPQVLFILAILAGGLSLVVFPFFLNILIDSSLVFCLGVGMGILNTAFDAILLQTIDEQVLGRVFSIVNGVSRFAMPLGVAGAGFLLGVWRTPSPIIIAMGIIMLMCIPGLIGLRNQDQRIARITETIE